MLTFTIITCNRPERLERCVGSLAPAVAKTCWDARILVIDSSTDPRTLEHNGATLARTAETCGVATHHVNAARKDELIDTVLEAADSDREGTVSRELLECALHGRGPLESVPGAGPNRNTMLLLAGGGPIISVDDDTEWNFRELSNDTPCCDDSPEVAGAVAPHLAMGIFGTDEELARHLQPCPGDVITEMRDSLRTDRIVMTGLYGKRWFEHGPYAYRLRGPLRAASYTPRSQYQRALTGAHAIQQARHRVRTRQPFLVTSCYGLHASGMLPPFPPAGHADDRCFAMLTQHCLPDTRTVHLPCSIHHIQDSNAPLDTAHVTDIRATVGRLDSLLIRYAIQNATSDSLESVGALLQTWAEVGTSAWLEWVHELYIAEATEEIEYLQHQLEHFDSEPAWWAADVRAYIEHRIEQAGVPQNAIPRELTARYDPAEALERYREYVYQYGGLLRIWPAVWNRVSRSG